MWLERYSAFEELGAVRGLQDFVSTTVENGMQQFPATRRTICHQNARYSMRLRALTAIELIAFHSVSLEGQWSANGDLCHTMWCGSVK